MVALLVIGAILDFPICCIFFIQEIGKSLVESRQRRAEAFVAITIIHDLSPPGKRVTR
jgi:hypothetical protein